MCKHVTWLICTYWYLDPPAVKLDTEHLIDLNDNWTKRHDFFSKDFWAIPYFDFFFSLAWNKNDFSRLSVTVGTLCICPVLNDHALTKGLHLYSLKNLPLLPSSPSPALIWDRWRERAKGDRSITAQLFEVSAGGGEAASRQEELLCCSWTPSRHTPIYLFPPSRPRICFWLHYCYHACCCCNLPWYERTNDWWRYPSASSSPSSPDPDPNSGATGHSPGKGL